MNREEFLKKIADMDLHTEYDQYFLYILNKNNFQLASISTVYTYQFSFCQAGLCTLSDSDCADFIKLVVVFVCSGADRKEEKRYYLKHRYLSHPSDYSFLSVSKEDGFMYLGSHLQTHRVQTEFTQREIESIKREHDTDLKDFELIEVD